jgi:hypothetical protein
MYSSETGDKVKRKRVLLSSDYRTAFKMKQVSDMFSELENSWFPTEINSQMC